MRTAISDEVGDRIDSIKDQLEDISRSLGLVIAVSLIVFDRYVGQVNGVVVALTSWAERAHYGRLDAVRPTG
jgi:hypothetical protein